LYIGGNRRGSNSNTVILSIPSGAENQPPTAIAGPDRTVHVGGTAQLNGSGTDPDQGDAISAYRWEIKSKPDGSSASLSNATLPNPTMMLDKEGPYVLSLVVTDSRGAVSAPDEVVISTLNSKPTADAGPDQVIKFLNTPVQLDGSKSSDPDQDLLTYSWTLIRPLNSNAALSDATAVSPTLVPDIYGKYEVQLIVSDGWQNSATDTVIITCENVRPVANAGPDQVIKVIGATVTLDSSLSSDANEDQLTCRWSLTKPDGTPGQLSDPAAAKPTFVADMQGEYLARLIVNDGQLDSEAATVKITFNNVAPVANAGDDQSIKQPGDTVTLQGSATDANGDTTLTYAWSFTSKPDESKALLENSGTLMPTFKADLYGDYVVLLTVSDGFGGIGTDTVNISFQNVAPKADAGPDQAVNFYNAQVSLDGSASHDENGDTLSYSWAFTQKPPGSLATPEGFDTATPSFRADLHGDYMVLLTVSDGFGGTATDSVTVSFNNLPPTASATGGGAYSVGQRVILNGIDSSDPNHDSLTYKWSLLSVPAGSAAVIADPSASAISLYLDARGQYEVQLVVNDGVVDSPPATVLITATLDTQAVTVAIQDLQQVTICGLAPTAFKNSTMKNTLINKLSSVVANIEAGKYQEALGQLQHDLLSKTDGCATSGAPDKNDWIKSCEEQAAVYQELQKIITMLQQLQ
jgi:hypothetical protein